MRKTWSRQVEARRERDRRRLGVGVADADRRQFRWQQAIDGYRRYLVRRPRDAAIVARLVQTLIAAGRMPEARSTLTRGLATRPDSAAMSRALKFLEQAEMRAGLVGLDRLDLHEVSLCAPPPPEIFGGTILKQSPDTQVYDQARAWLEYALTSTGAAAVYGDHLMVSTDGEGRIPALYGAAHRLDLMTMPYAPILALFADHALPGPDLDLRQGLIQAFDHGPVVHVPLVLGEGPWRLPEIPQSENAGTEEGGGEKTQPEKRSRENKTASRILAIVPTRDKGKVLRTLLDSLRTRSDRPDLLDILVIDNGSRDYKTLALLEDLRARGEAGVMRIDAPFNWSDLNNQAASRATQDILLFVNNDMVMLTDRWDETVRRHLAQPDIGVVGARMLYPAGNIQHAGLALGVASSEGGPSSPLHEGLGAASSEPGPMDRWVRNRPAAAVTGAFLAVRRTVFEKSGGFDALNFPVSCNDIDFCLRVRSLGLMVFYAADIELIHDESLTRGHDDSEARQARAQKEQAALIRIWGEDVLRDPSRNPHWVAHQVQIFHGLRAPEKHVVLNEIARGGQAWQTRCQPDSADAETAIDRL